MTSLGKQLTADLVTILRLAALTEDREKSEQAALDRVAARVDAELNRNVGRNPRFDEVYVCRGPDAVADGPRALRDSRAYRAAASAGHPRTCHCRSNGFIPSGGWSDLVGEVAG